MQNIDGGIHDEDVYVVGDDDEDMEEDDANLESERRDQGKLLSGEASSVNADPVPSASSNKEHSHDAPSPKLTTAPEQGSAPSVRGGSSSTTPAKYYIQTGDTLHSISLKYKLDVRAHRLFSCYLTDMQISSKPQIICRLNHLPLSTLRSTPHLLHTRPFLTLPASANILPPEDLAVEAERTALREREIARSRFQSVTKEVDWGITSAYVALSEPSNTMPDGDGCTSERLKEYDNEYGGEVTKEDKKTRAENAKLEERAVDQYMDDIEWEERERREGRGVSIPKFPLFEGNRGLPSGSTRGGPGLGNEKWTMPGWMRWKA